MNLILDFLHLFGFEHIDENSQPIVHYAICVWGLSLMGFFCFMNVLLYFSIINIINNKSLLAKFDNWPVVQRLIKFYGATRIYFILFEVF